MRRLFRNFTVFILILTFIFAAGACGFGAPEPTAARRDKDEKESQTEEADTEETETALSTTAAPETTAPTTTAAPSTTAAPTTTAAPQTTAAPTATAAPAPGKLDLQIGDSIEFGHFEQDNDESNGKEPIRWQVLDLSYDGKKALLISEDSLTNEQFDDDQADCGWKECSLRNWLNIDFVLTAFTYEEQHALVPCALFDTYLFSDLFPENADMVFCLTWNDVNALFNGNSGRIAKNSPWAEAEMKRRMLPSWFYPDTEAEVESTVASWNAQYGENCSWWWLREPAGAGVKADGSLRGAVDRRDLNSVRPSIWIDLYKAAEL